MTHNGIEGIHPYPAKFIAELPRALLGTLPIPPDTALLDPFCGCGTTLAECQRMGLPSVGIDLNPIACFTARVKTASRPFGLKKAVVNVVEQARQDSAVTIPPIPNLDHWFDRPVQHALAALTEAIDATSVAFRDAMRLTLSSIVVRVSRQESDTRYAAMEKNVTASAVFALFRRAAFRLDNALAERNYPLAPADVFEADVLTFDPSRIGARIGMIVTSPPYPNAYEYWLYHKYRMYWHGFDPLAVKAHEIGVRTHFFKRNHHTEDDFARQMAQTFDLMSFNLSHANIKTERVLVLKRRKETCS